MELSKQVVSLENAKKLKELGIKQESEFWWTDDIFRGVILMREGEWFEGSDWKPRTGDGDVSAYTVSELMEMMPERIEDTYTKSVTKLTTRKQAKKYLCYYASPDGISIKTTHESLADALALLLIHLIESSLWKPTNYLP